jgi:hypothetical protein
MHQERARVLCALCVLNASFYGEKEWISVFQIIQLCSTNSLHTLVNHGLLQHLHSYAFTFSHIFDVTAGAYLDTRNQRTVQWQPALNWSAVLHLSAHNIHNFEVSQTNGL